MSANEPPRTYRFGDANRPGLLLGLTPRQATPIIAGVLGLALVLQTPVHPALGLPLPVLGIALSFGRLRGTPLSETIGPGLRLVVAGRRRRWVSQLDALGTDLPRQLDGLELLERGSEPRAGPAFVFDRPSGTLSAIVRVRGFGFPLASADEQATMLDRWGGAIAPFARDRSPVVAVTWQAWAHPSGPDAHRDFLDDLDIDARTDDPSVADYLDLVDRQGPTTVAHEVLVTLTVDLRRVRTRRSTPDRVEAAMDALTDEVRSFTGALEADGLSVDPPLPAVDIALAVRARSDPSSARRNATLNGSLAAAAGHGSPEWGPMVVEPSWTTCRVDGALHRSYRVATWPQLPVPSDWLATLVADAGAVRTVTVVMEPVPIAQAARAADREVMAREADADMRQERGFRIPARERKRLAEVEARERELSDGQPEFRFVALIDVTASDLDLLDEACAAVEQAAAQSLLDLRPLDSRHDQGWVAALPLGRTIRRRR